MEITVLCKVVDNFGDIGVTWRLCQQLKNKYPETDINLIVDDLSSFKKIWSEVEIEPVLQNISGIKIYNWNEYDFCYSEFSGEKQDRLEIILECFQCGRPDWMEKILFDDYLDHTVQIIMIDYLTAEKYAEDFHKLKSLTRKAKVQKVNFMPGFTEKTGGLIIDKNWEKLPERNSCGNILFFTYEKAEFFWSGVLRAFEKANIKNEINIAQGRGMNSFEQVLVRNGVEKTSVNYRVLPFMDQSKWDETMRSSSVLFIRGEESMSRACLAGIPFVWHAYPQTDEYQLVKMNALLERLKRHFSAEHFEIVRNAWTVFNCNEKDLSENKVEEAVYNFLVHAENMADEFKDFSQSLLNNGDMVTNLMTFINQISII